MAKAADRRTNGVSDEVAGEERNVALLVNEIQLLLAEKRTVLAVMRTGIAILALPLSVLSVLIATSEYYDMANVIHLLVPVLVINAGLVVLAVYLVGRSLKRLRLLDRLITMMKNRSPTIASLITCPEAKRCVRDAKRRRR